MRKAKFLESGIEDALHAAVRPRNWDVAEWRRSVIAPFIDKPEPKRSEVIARAKEFDLHPRTVKSWLAKYAADPRLGALLPKIRNDIGRRRLAGEVENIVRDLTNSSSWQHSSMRSIAAQLHYECGLRGLAKPHYNTVRAWLAHTVSKTRRYRPAPSHSRQFAPPSFSLSSAQLDHTELDVMVCDESRKTALGRPWLTLLFDMYSRAVLGVSVSLDRPNAYSIGRCVSHAILPKDTLLAECGLEAARWPCFGIPETIYVDSAKGMSTSFEQACASYGISLVLHDAPRIKYRRYLGGLFRDLDQKIGTIPPTCITDTGDAKNKPPAVTFEELDRFLIARIASYNSTLNDEVGGTPIDRFEEGLKASPRMIDLAKGDRLRLDFLPPIKRRAQKYGVVIDGICYDGPALRRWLNREDLADKTAIFKQDLRDLSRIWFLDPELNIYFVLSCRYASFPQASKWEVHFAKKLIRRNLERVNLRRMDEKLEMTEAVGRVLNAKIDLRGRSISEHALGRAICREIFESIFGERFPNVDCQTISWLRTKSRKTFLLDGYCRELSIAFDYQVQRSENSRIGEFLARLCTEHKIQIITVGQFSNLNDARDCERHVRESLSRVLGSSSTYSETSIQP